MLRWEVRLTTTANRGHRWDPHRRWNPGRMRGRGRRDRGARYGPWSLCVQARREGMGDMPLPYTRRAPAMVVHGGRAGPWLGISDTGTRVPGAAGPVLYAAEPHAG